MIQKPPFAARLAATLALLTLAAPRISQAQGSSYTAAGIGTVQTAPNVRAVSMGGVSIAFPNDYSVNLYNPAALVGISITRLEGAIYWDGVQAKTGDAKDFSTTASLSYFSFAVPIGKDYVLGFGAHRYTLVNYDFVVPSSNGNKPLTEQLLGDGGYNFLTVSLANRLTSNLYLGIGIQYIIGNANRLWAVQYEDETFDETEDRLEENMRGLRLQFGTQFQVGPWLFGGLVSKSVAVTNDAVLEHVFDETSSQSNGDNYFPLEIGVGGSYRLSKSVAAGLDFIWTRWGNFNFRDDLNDYRNTIRIAAGLERRPVRERPDHWWENLYYRAGFYFQNLYVVNSSGEFADEFALTLGLGVPFNNRQGVFELGMELGRRGSVATHRVQDTFVRVYIGFSGGEKWFQSRKERNR